MRDRRKTTRAHAAARAFSGPISGLIALLIVAAPSNAAVVTIHEGGPTVPIGQFLPAVDKADSATTAANLATVPPPQVTLPFPITTPSMRAGSLQTTTRLRTSGWLTAPLFIVGDDPSSREWLQANRSGLQRLGARGLVVNVSTLAAYRSLRDIVPDVPMAPGSAEALARQTGLRVYPLFVAVDGQVSQRLP